jgi:UDP-GlcNAc:undecaprenyl-phosphate GlcNAc-1-phosphate transferase
MASLIWVGTASFALSLLLTKVLRDVFRWLGIVDRPEGKRKIHRAPIPRGGGLAVALAYVASYLLVRWFFGSGFDQQLVLVWKILPATAVILVVGLMDDLFGLRPWQKLAGQMVGAGLACWKGIVIAGGSGSHQGVWWGIPLTVIWLLICSNAFNLVDGMDGLAAGLGLVSTFAMFFGAQLQHNTLLAMATIPLAGALLGFLRYNFNPATIFLGDSGSLSIGFVLGCFSVLWIGESPTLHRLAAPLIALSIPLLDVTLAIGRRLLRGQHVFAADRRHIHHRLLDRGMTPRKAVLVLYAAGVVVSLVALWHQNTLGGGAMSGLILLLFGGAAVAAIRYLGYSEFEMAGKMVLRGDMGRFLAAQLDLRTFETAISRSATPAACAEVVVTSVENLGCRVTKVRFAGYITGSRAGFPAPGWTFRVPLDDGDFIELAREFGDDSSSAHIGPLVDLLRASLMAKGRTFNGSFTVPQIVPGRVAVGGDLVTRQADRA